MFCRICLGQLQTDVVTGLIFHSRLVYGKEKVRGTILTVDVENTSLDASRKKNEGRSELQGSLREEILEHLKLNEKVRTSDFDV